MEEKIALVTGASRGIGSQIAKTLAKKNIFVVVNSAVQRAARIMTR